MILNKLCFRIILYVMNYYSSELELICVKNHMKKIKKNRGYCSLQVKTQNITN